MISVYDTMGNEHPVVIQTDKELAARNQLRLQEAKEKLGTHWVLHRKSTYAVNYKERK